jgi:hypothetical protein
MARNESFSHHHNNNEQNNYDLSLNLSLQHHHHHSTRPNCNDPAQIDNATNYYGRTQTSIDSSTSYPNYYGRTQTSIDSSTSYPNYYGQTQAPIENPAYTNSYDRIQRPDQQNRENEFSTQAALDCWAPRRSVSANDYRNPETFSNPYNDLDAALQINQTQGLDAARSTFLRSIKDADGIDFRSVKADHKYDLQNLNRINSSENNIARNGGSFEDMQNLEQQRQLILHNDTDLKNLYYAPANTRISMGLACLKTGDPAEMSEGQRLIEEAKEKRPQIARDPRLQQMIDEAVQVGYAARNYGGADSGYQEPEFNPPQITHAPAPLWPELQTGAQNSQPVPSRRQPWHLEYKPSETAAPVEATPNQPAPVEPVTSVVPARTYPDVQPPAVVPVERVGMQHPTIAAVEHGQTRISDAEATNWMNSRYQHLTVASLVQNTRDSQTAYQKAADDTSYSMNPFDDSRDERGKVNGDFAFNQKKIEYMTARNAELRDIFALAKQPHSHDSDLARQALITIIKNSAGSMADEPFSREISQECSAQVKELCAPNANGRSEMLDAIKGGLTESSHIPGGAKSNLLDGLELLADPQAPEISKQTAGTVALLALQHELDNAPRLGAPALPGQSTQECIQREVRLIGMIDKFGHKDALNDLKAIVKSNAPDEVRTAAQQAILDLQSAS